MEFNPFPPQSFGCCGCVAISVLIPIVVVLTLALIGPAVGNVFTNITTAL